MRPTYTSGMQPVGRRRLMFAAMEHLAELGVVACVCERLLSRYYPGPHIFNEALVHGLHAPIRLHSGLADLAVNILRFTVLQHLGNGWSYDHYLERGHPALTIRSGQQFLGHHASERHR